VSRSNLAAARPSAPETPMLTWAIIFFLISVVAAVFGFTGIAVGAQAVARVLFGLFVILFLIVLIFGVLAGRALF
jgi:uncharacterized membrane protein YtjA (UPF0391 family)